jgi:tetratricopeptide (TPR) repeat protein
VLLLWLLVAAQAPAFRPQHDLAGYLALAARYRSGDRLGAIREIGSWPSAEIDAAVEQLRGEEERLIEDEHSPEGIPFRTVEAAVLLHAEAGLSALQIPLPADGSFNLSLARRMLDWSHRAARRQQPPIEPRIDRREFHLAVGGMVLGLGVPQMASSLADEARRIAPLDPDVLLLDACVSEALALEHRVRHDDGRARQLFDEAEARLRDTLAVDPGRVEARLRLGHVLLEQGRSLEAEPPLERALEEASENRQRYLALLFLGRVSERQDRPGPALDFYVRAVGAWPQSQAARLALALALEAGAGPAAARVQVLACLAASGRNDRPPDPWWRYPNGQPDLAQAMLERVWEKALKP